MNFIKENIPNELKQRRQWIPVAGKKPLLKDWPNPARQMDFEAAAAKSHPFPGLVLRDGLFCLDCDKVLKDGKPSPGLVEIMKKVKEKAGSTYTEKSQSGKGLHMFFTANIPTDAPDTLKFPLEGGGVCELYTGTGKGRFIAVTGHKVGKADTVADGQAVLDFLIEKAARKKQKNENAGGMDERPCYLSADEIPAIIRKSASGELFKRLYDDGDISDYNNDHSAADIALMNLLPFYCAGRAEIMEQVFSKSALGQRDKWQRKDYRNRTVQRALSDWNGECYNPEYGKTTPEEDFENLDKAGDLLNYALTDYGNAERLQKVYGDSLIYVPECNRWYEWDGTRWAKGHDKDSVELYHKLGDIMRVAYKQARLSPVNDEKARAAMLSFFRRSENTANIRNGLAFARSLFLTDLEKLDSVPYLLNCPNCTINLKTGETMPHEKADYITMVTAANYVPGAKSPEWQNTIESILPDSTVRLWTQKFMGYCLFGLTSEEKFLFLYGPGGGGKGTFIESIGHTLGDYTGIMDIDTILAARNDAGDGGQPTPQLAALAGKRLILTSESGAGRKFNSARIKLITGGDKITARFLRGNPFEFTPQFTLVMSSNYKPALTDTTDEGMRRRLIIVPFTTRIDRKDIHLKERLRKTENLEAILSWCVEGAVLWWRDGLGDTPPAIKKVMGDYYNDNDLLGQFLDECCIINDKEKIKTKELLKAFNYWLSDGQAGRSVTLRTFTEQMENRGFKKHRYTDGVFFDGLSHESDLYSIFN